MDKTKYFVVKKKALPEVLIKVVEAKRLLASERASDRFREGDDCTGSNRCHGYQQKFFL